MLLHPRSCVWDAWELEARCPLDRFWNLGVKDGEYREACQANRQASMIILVSHNFQSILSLLCRERMSFNPHTSRPDTSLFPNLSPFLMDFPPACSSTDTLSVAGSGGASFGFPGILTSLLPACSFF